MTAVTTHDVATLDERMEAGRALRESVPRTSHAELPTTGPRPDPIAILQDQGEDRLGSVDVETARPAGVTIYRAICGATLARAHARSGDAAMISGSIGSGHSFGKAMLAFAEAYADQTERDHALLVSASKDGAVPAEEGI